MHDKFFFTQRLIGIQGKNLKDIVIRTSEEFGQNYLDNDIMIKVYGHERRVYQDSNGEPNSSNSEESSYRVREKHEIEGSNIFVSVNCKRKEHFKFVIEQV